MKIYTKTGDGGETSLLGGKRVPKDTLRVEAYGTIDELNSILGVSRSFNLNGEIDTLLSQIQSELFTMGAELAASGEDKAPGGGRISDETISRLERQIDDFESRLPGLKNFILPGGNRPASSLHHARTVCRRSERLLVSLMRREQVRGILLVYLNRLSDLLFVMARLSNHLSNDPETIWRAG